MTADIYALYGLRGPPLHAFRAAAAIVARNMIARQMEAHDPEDVLRSMRAHLAAAAQEPSYERGMAQVAIAGNRLAVYLHIVEGK